LAARKGKDTQNEHQASLIPVIEKQEQQLRTELEKVRLDADNHVHQAEKQAEQHILESRLSISELVEQKRKKELMELQKHAKQLSHSSMKHGTHLERQSKKNMALAVQRLVEAVTNMGDET